jgi:hypothetical protein
MLAPAVADFIEIFEGVGSFIFGTLSSLNSFTSWSTTKQSSTNLEQTAHVGGTDHCEPA